MNVSRTFIVLVVAVLIAGGMAVMRTLDQMDSNTANEVLSVDQVAKKPATFADQEVHLTGVVSAVLPDKHLFTVIDEAEYASCKVTSCSQYQIPIAYAGDLPVIEVAVTVTGRLTQPEPGRYLFQATTLEIRQ